MGFKRILKKKSELRILSLVLALFLIFFLDFVNASQLNVVAPNTIYQGCAQPYVIKMDTNGIATKSVDTKLFLTGYFTFNSPYVKISDAVVAQIGYANYIPGQFNMTTVQTGIANSGENQYWQYLYINSYQLGGFSSLTGDNISIATFYFKANSWDTGYLNFYFITGWNGDDSNISSGINEGIIAGSYTQYVDSLISVSNLEQSFSGSNVGCTSKPYISSAYYWQTGYISTSTGVQEVWTSVIAGPLYSGLNDRTVWTKGNVKLIIDGISDSYIGSGGLIIDDLSTGIQLTYVNVLNDPYISPITPNTSWSNQSYEIGISGNISTGFVGFDNIIGNTGSTYLSGGQKYADTFNMDVFWIDTVSPVNVGYFTGYIANTGAGFTQYTLSGINFSGRVSNPTNGFHAAWTTMDDEYKVISFSGTNSITQDCTDKGYSCTTTGYMDYLNTTGYVRSGNNIFKLIHNISFTNTFYGYVIVMDRAGNTGQWNISINMDSLIVVHYGLIAYPQVGVARNQLIQLSGLLIKLAIYSGGFDKTQLMNGLIYTGWLKTSSTGYADFTGNFASGQYRVLAEGMNTLTYLLSGVQLSSVGGTVDYTQTYISGFYFGDTYAIITTLGSKHASYLSQGANRDGIINVADLANLVTIWGEFGTIDTNSNIGIYSGSYFVDIPSNGTGRKIIPYSLLQSTGHSSIYMQYHPYDLNSNGLVDLNDYSLANGNYNKTGATYGGKLDGAASATMPF